MVRRRLTALMALALFLGCVSLGQTQQLQDLPVGDTASTPAVEAALAGCPTCIERRVDVAVLEAVSINLIAVTLNRFYYGTGVDLDTWKSNFEQGFQWDSNQFRANYLEHPIAGSGFLNAGRSNGMGYWESIPLVVGGSLMFEFTGEADPPAANDLITTTFGGITVGEALYRLSSLVLDNRSTGATRVVREIGAALINPVRGINRLLYGRVGAIGPNDFDRSPGFLAMQFELGARRLADGSSLENGATDSYLAFNLVYGDPIERRLSTPFEAFEFSVQVGGSTDQFIDRLQVVGSLWGSDLNRGAGVRHKFIVSLEHEFNENPEYRYGQNSVNMGILSRWPLSDRWSVRTNAAVEAVPFGAVSTGFVSDRGYEFGIGAGVAVGARLFHRSTRLAELSYKAVWLGTVSGVTEDNLVQFGVARLALPILGSFGVGADGILFRRNSHAGGLPEEHQRSPQLRLYTSWAFN